MNKIDRLISNNKYLSYINQINEKEIDREFCRHGIEHCLDVARISYIMNLENNLGFDKEIIYATALLHDIGRASEYENGNYHDKAGGEIARELLLGTGFNEDEIVKICQAITEHRSINDSNPLSSLLYKADKLSRNCFACKVYDKCYWQEEIKNKGIII